MRIARHIHFRTNREEPGPGADISAKQVGAGSERRLVRRVPAINEAFPSVRISGTPISVAPERPPRGSRERDFTGSPYAARADGPTALGRPPTRNAMTLPVCERAPRCRAWLFVRERRPARWGPRSAQDRIEVQGGVGFPDEGLGLLRPPHAGRGIDDAVLRVGGAARDAAVALAAGGTVRVRSARRTRSRTRDSTWYGLPSVNQAAPGQLVNFAMDLAPSKSRWRHGPGVVLP